MSIEIKEGKVRISKKPSLKKLREMIFQFLAEHKGIIYDPKDLQLAMIAHKYPVSEVAGVTTTMFQKALDKLIAEQKVSLYVRLAS